MEEKKQTIQKKNQTLDEMVFENRNKAYGAYDLRTIYGKHITKAMLIGGLAFALGVASPLIFAKISPSDGKNLREVEINLEDLKEKKEEEKKPDVPLPPPPPEVKQPEVAQIKFIPPEPKPDEEVKQEEPPPPAEKIEKAVIASETKKGVETESMAAPPPTEEPAAKPAEVEKPKEDQIFTVVEQNPEFPGGTGAMMRFLGENIKYPSAAQRANVAGRVFLSFVVNTDGSIVDVQVLKGLGFGCDEEAMRVVKEMPKWNPGKQSGRNVRVKYTLPVVFRLE